MWRVAILLAATSAQGGTRCTFELAFVDKKVADFEAGGRAAVQHGGDSYLQGMWRVPGAWCDATLVPGVKGWRNTTQCTCYGYSRAPGAAPTLGDRPGQFAALPVFPQCDWAAAFSGLGMCVGTRGQYVPLGVVTQMDTSGNVTMFTHHSVYKI